MLAMTRSSLCLLIKIRTSVFRFGPLQLKYINHRSSFSLQFNAAPIFYIQTRGLTTTEAVQKKSRLTIDDQPGNTSRHV